MYTNKKVIVKLMTVRQDTLVLVADQHWLYVYLIT